MSLLYHFVNVVEPNKAKAQTLLDGVKTPLIRLLGDGSSHILACLIAAAFVWDDNASAEEVAAAQLHEDTFVTLDTAPFEILLRY